MRRSAVLAGSLAAAAALALVGVADPAAAGDPAHRGAGEQPAIEIADPAAACAALTGLEIAAAEIALPTQGGAVQSADLIPAGTNPEYCRVRGQVVSFDPAAPPINFQLILPSTWVRRSMQLGGGGFNGSVVSGTGNVPGTGSGGPATPLQRNYATFGGDSGNATNGGPAGSFGLNAESFSNYSGESVKRTRDAAQVVIEAYYGEAPRQQYFAGGSKGGHEALVAAQRYGDDYDGIIAYYPAAENLWLIYGWDNLLRLSREVPGAALNGTEQQLVEDHVMATCDGLDDATDGVIANRDGCDAALDLTAIACPGGADTGDDCLSAPQIESLEASAQPAPLPYPAPDGGTTTGGFPFLQGADLGNWMSPFTGYDFFNNGVIRYWYFKDPTVTDEQVTNFDWIADQALVEPVTNEFDATDPDIDEFLAGGGKLILVQGTIDHLVAPSLTDDYYEALQDEYRGRLRNTVRYYVQPGYGHGNGEFNLSYDSLTALDRWVTKGAAPANQVGYDGNPSGRSMPLCDYPTWPRYDGTGDPDIASNYRCVE